MVPAPTYQNLPTFGTGATLVQPIAGTYNGGFLPGQLFPAEYENWLMNYITANSNTSQVSLVNLVAEMGTILTAASITPNAGSTVQLYAALNALYATVGALSAEAALARNASNLSGGTIPNARISALPYANLALDPSDAANLASGFVPLARLPGRGMSIIVSPGSGNFTVPSGVYFLTVTLVGPGAGGGAVRVTSGFTGVASGGGSGAVQRSFLSVTPGQIIPYVVGAGGIGASAPGSPGYVVGSAGTSTTFAGAITAASGTPGGQSHGLNAVGNYIGSSQPDAGNAGTGSSTDGTTATQAGRGGGGGVGVSGAAAGGNGGPGEIIVEW